MTDVASQSGIVACLTEDVEDQTGGGGLAVGTRDTDHLRCGVATGKLNLADDGNALLNGLADHRGCVGNSGTLDDFIGIQDELLGMVPFLPRDAPFIEHLLVFVDYLRHV